MGGGRLPVVNGKRVIQALTRAGFVVNRIAAAITFSSTPAIRREQSPFRFMPGET
jgi:hypothetical protein